MSRIDAIEAEADRRRAAFAASLAKLRRKLTPLGLADEGLRRLDPQAHAVDVVGQSLRKNPLPAIPLLLGLGWLALNARRPSRPAKPGKLKRSRRKALVASQKKEPQDENDDQKTQSD
jgi:hypothetical protein